MPITREVRPIAVPRLSPRAAGAATATGTGTGTGRLEQRMLSSAPLRPTSSSPAASRLTPVGANAAAAASAAMGKRRVALVRADEGVVSAPVGAAVAAKQQQQQPQRDAAESLREKRVEFVVGSEATAEARRAWGLAEAEAGAVANGNGNGNGHGHGHGAKLPPPTTTTTTTTASPTTAVTGAIPLEPRGLVNRGATCYLNAVLQGVTHCAPFVRVLLALPPQTLINGSDKPDALELARRHLMGCVRSSTTAPAPTPPPTTTRRNRTPPMDPVALLRVVRASIRGGASPGVGLGALRQEDAHEALRVLLESMQRACLVRMGLPALLTDARSEKTAIHDVFGGTLRTTTKCPSCGHESIKDDAFLDLSLDLGRTLPECVGKLLTPETLSADNKWCCDKCSKRVRATRTPSIAKAPKVLVVHLKRFAYSPRGGRVKLKNPVKTSETLSLPVASASASASATEHVPYILSACVVHLGHSPNSGHYYARARAADGVTWFEFDDEDVRVVRPERVFGETQAYLLFFVRRDLVGFGSSTTVSAAATAATTAAAAPALSIAVPPPPPQQQPLSPNGRATDDDEEREQEPPSPVTSHVSSTASSRTRALRAAFRSPRGLDKVTNFFAVGRHLSLRRRFMMKLRSVVRGAKPAAASLLAEKAKREPEPAPTSTPPPPPPPKEPEPVDTTPSPFSFDVGGSRGVPRASPGSRARRSREYDAWDAALDKGRAKKRKSSFS